MKLSLVVTTAGKAQGQVIPVKLAQFVIGRDPQCNLRPASALISKRHCAVLIKSGQVFVRDFDSTNGTFINEKPVKGEAPLQNEDELKVGPLCFKVVIEEQASVSKPTPPPKAPGGADDEAAAAMLLSLQDEDGADGTGGDAGVPPGSTVFDLPNATGAPGEADAKKLRKKSPTPRPPPPPPPRPPNRSSPSTRAGNAELVEPRLEGPRGPSKRGSTGATPCRTNRHLSCTKPAFAPGCAAACLPGSTGTRALCPGGAAAIPTPSGSAKSCCSKRKLPR